jgi:hypothetical protein
MVRGIVTSKEATLARAPTRERIPIIVEEKGEKDRYSGDCTTRYATTTRRRCNP